MKSLVFSSLAGDASDSKPFCDVAFRPDPDPTATAPRALLLDVAAAGLNYADVLQRAGKYPLRPKKVPPYTPGLEVAGVVAAVGSAVEHFGVGDLVAALVLDGGACADKCVVQEDYCFRVPQTWTAPQAAAFPLNYLTAYYALVDQARVRRGEWVMVTAAAGGVGTAAVDIALKLGAKVCAVSSSSAKLADLETKFPVDACVAYSSDDMAGFKAAVQSKVSAGINVLLDGVGGALFDAACDCLSSFGRAVTFGLASGQVPANHLVKLIVKQVTLSGVNVDLVSKENPAHIRFILQQIFELITTPPVIGSLYPFSANGLEDAIRNLQSTSPTIPGKLVIEVTKLPTSAVQESSSGHAFRTERHMISTTVGTIHAVVHTPAEISKENPLVCLHMAPRSVDEFTEFCDAMMTENPRPLILLDTVGYGFSDPSSSVTRIPLHAAAVMQVLDHLVPFGMVDILGHLTGAFIALELTIENSERVQCLFLVDLLYFDESLRSKLREWSTEDTRRLDFDSDNLLVDIARKRQAFASPKLNVRCIADELRAGGEGTSHEAVSMYKIENRLPLLQNRTILISGSESLIFFDKLGWRATESLSLVEKMVPAAEAHIVQGGNLMICNVMADTLARIVISAQV